MAESQILLETHFRGLSPTAPSVGEELGKMSIEWYVDDRMDTWMDGKMERQSSLKKEVTPREARQQMEGNDDSV